MLLEVVELTWSTPVALRRSASAASCRSTCAVATRALCMRMRARATPAPRLHRACTAHAPSMHRQCTTHHACAMHVLSGPARCACARAHTPRPPPHIAAARRPAASRAPSWRPPARHAPGAAAATCHAQGSDASCSWFMCRVLRGHLHTRHMGHGHGHGHGHGTWDMDMGTDRPARGPLLTLHGAHRMLCRIPRAVAYTTALGDDRGGVLGVVGCRGYPQLRGRSVATRGGGNYGCTAASAALCSRSAPSSATARRAACCSRAASASARAARSAACSAAAASSAC